MLLTCSAFERRSLVLCADLPLVKAQLVRMKVERTLSSCAQGDISAILFRKKKWERLLMNCKGTQPRRLIEVENNKFVWPTESQGAVVTVRSVSVRSHWCQLYLFIGIFLNIFQELMGMSPTADNVVNS